MLTVVEELALLLIDDRKGGLVHVGPIVLDWVTAGGVLAELALRHRIEITDGRVIPLDPDPTGENLLDPTLLDIVESRRGRSLLYWLKLTVARAEVIREIALSRLVDRNILFLDDEGVHTRSRWVREVRKYPPELGLDVAEVRTRIMELLLSDIDVDPRDSVLVSVAHASDVLSALMSKQEIADLQTRVEHICAISPFAMEILREVEKGIATTSATPVVKGLPLIGNVMGMSGDVRKFFTEQYLKLGPVFRIKLLHREYTVLAGAEANNFVHRYGRDFLRSKETWQDLDAEFGASRSMVSSDGDEHVKLRKQLKDGYSQNIIARQLDRVVDLVRQESRNTLEGKPQRVLYTMQRIVTEQLGVLTTGFSPRDYLDDLIVFLEIMLLYRVTKARPGFEFNKPRARRARHRLIEFSKEVLAAHDPHLRRGQETDLVDAFLEMHRSEPDTIPETDFIQTALGPFFAGLETAASAASFLLYSLLKNPNLLERSREEADEFFNGELTAARAHETFDVIRRSMMESMRMYPVAPSLIRTVSNSFDFEGYRIPAGEQLMIALSVPSQLPQYFPDPDVFDIDRYLPERAEHRQQGVYVPFGLGTHRCLGADLAELMVMTNIATLIHDYEIEFSSPKYELKLNPIPTLRPDNNFKINFVRRRSTDTHEEPLRVSNI